jgi:hypothetical protein
MLSTHRLPAPAAEPADKPEEPAVKSAPPSRVRLSPPPAFAMPAPADEPRRVEEKPAEPPARRTTVEPAAQASVKAPEAAPPASPNSPEPAATPPLPAENAAPAPLTDLDRRVDEQFEARLDQEVNAVLATVPASELSKKLREVSGEEMEDRLRVSYTLATDSATTRYGYVEDMHLTAEVRGEEGNTVLIKVAINKDELRPEHVQMGAGVTAKVECGRRAVGYVWFHDLVAFFHKTWFRWF